MFDEKAMKEAAEKLQAMSSKERRKRAKNLKKLLDAEMKKRNMVNEAATKKRGQVWQWLVSHFKDD